MRDRDDRNKEFSIVSGSLRFAKRVARSPLYNALSVKPNAPFASTADPFYSDHSVSPFPFLDRCAYPEIMDG